MPFSHVGGQAAKRASEEAHRPQPPERHSGDWNRPERSPAPPVPPRQLVRSLAGRRLRLQWAGAAALLTAIVLAVLLPARSVRIMVDGAVTTVESRANSDVSAVRQAGVDLQPGDKIERAGGEDELVVRRATEAHLAVDGRVFSLRTQAETIDRALQEAGVDLQPQDSVLRDDVFVSESAPVSPPTPLAVLLAGADTAFDAPTTEAVQLQVRRAVPFTVVQNGQQLELRSSRETVATALRDVGVRLGPGDDVQPPLDTELTAGLQVHVEHATQVVVTLPDAKTVLYTLAGTVGEALAEGGVELPADYRLDPPAEAPITEGLVIHVVGISAEDVLETERIESKTVYEPDASLPYGQRRVVQGQDGVHYQQYRLVYENGDLVSRELAEEWDDPVAADTVVYYSTADPPSVASPAVDAPPDSGNVVRVLSVYATWYNPASAGRSPSDPSYGITATGIPVDRGVCAVDPSVIPLGTRFYVPGYGNCVAADTGGGIRGEMIDLGYPDGVVPGWVSHWVDIYILGP